MTDTDTAAHTGTPAEATTGPPVAVVRDDAHALQVAAELAEEFRAGSSRRDLDRELPWAEVARLSSSGLLAITVPREYGGAGVSTLTVVSVIRILAGADGSLGQIPQNHFWFLEAIHHAASDEQKDWLYAGILAGKRLGNAAVPARAADGSRIDTTIAADGDAWRISGTKAYSTGALFADWIPVSVRDPERGQLTAFVERDAPGVTVVDDWDAIGQRTTASGTVVLDQVRVPETALVNHAPINDNPTVFRAFGLLMHAGIDTGIAEAALRDAAGYLSGYRRGGPGRKGPDQPVSGDPVTIQKFGELAVLVRSARALLESAARTVDDARAALEAPGVDPDHALRTEGEAVVAMAAARAQAHTAAMRVSGDWYDLAGASAVVGGKNFDRHWRDARTHTLHDPRILKVAEVGAFELNGDLPERPQFNPSPPAAPPASTPESTAESAATRRPA